MEKNGWDKGEDGYRYYENGEPVKNNWRKSGDFWFFLGNDGLVTKDTLISYKGERYYVNQDGAMVTNSWAWVRNPDNASSRSWCYFRNDGKLRESGSKYKSYPFQNRLSTRLFI